MMTPERLAEARYFISVEPGMSGVIARAVLAERDELLAEVDRLRAQVAAVEALLPRWESEVDERTKAKEFGIAEGLSVALEGVREALQ